MTEHCRNWIGDERCGKPAEFIVWGKLNPPEALGPRCYDCAAEQIGHHPLRRNDNSYAVYRLPDGPASPLRYTTERARMRLREVLATAEWPKDGTAEEYFIREVFPNDPDPDECDHEFKMSSYGRCVKCGTKPDESDTPASPVLGDEEREHLESIATFMEGQFPNFRGAPVGRDIDFLRTLASRGEERDG